MLEFFPPSIPANSGAFCNKHTDRDRIKSAAIRYPNGNIYTGKYHGKCFEAAAEAGEVKDGGRVDQGFMTENGIFVDRQEARKIAIKAFQCRTETIDKKILYSEDLY